MDTKAYALSRYHVLRLAQMLAQAAKRFQEDSFSRDDDVIDSYYREAIGLYERYAPDHPRLAWILRSFAAFMRSDHEGFPTDAEGRESFAREMEQKADRISGQVRRAAQAYASSGQPRWYRADHLPARRRQRLTLLIADIVGKFVREVREGMPSVTLIARALQDLLPFLFDSPDVAPVAYAGGIARAREQVEIELITLVSDLDRIEPSDCKRVAEKLLLVIVRENCAERYLLPRRGSGNRKEEA